MSLPLPKRRRRAAAIAKETAREAPARISPGRGAASSTNIAHEETCGSEVIMLGSICSGIGVCHRAAAVVNASNAGGLTFRDAFACEIDRHARKVLTADFPGLRLFGDICEDGVRLPPCDVLAVGFACQPFSPANRRRKGSLDERCGVVAHVIRYIERATPSMIVMENVVGLLSRARGVHEFGAAPASSRLQHRHESLAQRGAWRRAPAQAQALRSGAPVADQGHGLAWEHPDAQPAVDFGRRCWPARRAAVCTESRRQDRRSRMLSGSLRRHGS